MRDPESKGETLYPYLRLESRVAPTVPVSVRYWGVGDLSVLETKRNLLPRFVRVLLRTRKNEIPWRKLLRHRKRGERMDE